MRSLLVLLAGALTVLALGLATPALAQADSIEISTSANPTQGEPVTVTVSGSTEQARKLYVYVSSEYTFCASTPYSEADNYGASPLSSSSGDSISGGSFTKEYSYTPATANTKYQLCAYIDSGSSETPNATAEESFTSLLPSGSIGISTSASPTQGEPVTVTVSGSTEQARKLYVYVSSEYTFCASTPYSEANNYGASPLSSSSGDSISAGSFSKAYTYTPSATNTKYQLCAYIDEGSSATPNATAETSFNTDQPSKPTGSGEGTAGGGGGAFGPSPEEAQQKLAAYLKGVAERGHCEALSSEYPSSSVEACKADEAAIHATQEAKEEQEIKAEEAVLASKRDAAHKRPVRHLSVKAVAHNGRTSSSPGYTNFDVTTAPYAYVTIHLSRYGHRTYSVEWGEHDTERALRINWSCKSPGGLYRYVVTAHTNVGHTLTRRGTFAPISVALCHEMEQREAEARARHEREVTEQYEHEAHQEAEQHQEEVRLYEKNCKALGGTPALVEYPGGEQYYRCRAPGGGTIPGVPY